MCALDLRYFPEKKGSVGKAFALRDLRPEFFKKGEQIVTAGNAKPGRFAVSSMAKLPAAPIRNLRRGLGVGAPVRLHRQPNGLRHEAFAGAFSILPRSGFGQRGAILPLLAHRARILFRAQYPFLYDASIKALSGCQKPRRIEGRTPFTLSSSPTACTSGRERFCVGKSLVPERKLKKAAGFCGFAKGKPAAAQIGNLTRCAWWGRRPARWLVKNTFVKLRAYSALFCRAGAANPSQTGEDPFSFFPASGVEPVARVFFCARLTTYTPICIIEP